MSTIMATLTEGSGVVIRDRQGCARPILGQVAEITGKHIVVRFDTGVSRQFERATGFALLPGEHDRWQIDICEAAGSEEYGDLLIRQGQLQAERERIQQELDLIGAVLATADGG